jgi:hypothetical protein
LHRLLSWGSLLSIVYSYKSFLKALVQLMLNDAMSKN